MLRSIIGPFLCAIGLVGCEPWRVEPRTVPSELAYAPILLDYGWKSNEVRVFPGHFGRWATNAFPRQLMTSHRFPGDFGDFGGWANHAFRPELLMAHGFVHTQL